MTLHPGIVSQGARTSTYKSPRSAEIPLTLSNSSQVRQPPEPEAARVTLLNDRLTTPLVAEYVKPTDRSGPAMTVAAVGGILWALTLYGFAFYGMYQAVRRA